MEQQDEMSKQLISNEEYDKQSNVAMALAVIFLTFALSVMTGAKPLAAAVTILAGLAVIFVAHVVIRIILSIKSGAHS